ncbi:hypothetical protein JYT81_00180 [Gammaproteobacteria bacterium AH-315-K14]|nr:hypothetical protein [Gammaproteobacteria bacterium AH-315-K14]
MNPSRTACLPGDKSLVNGQEIEWVISLTELTIYGISQTCFDGQIIGDKTDGLELFL